MNTLDRMGIGGVCCFLDLVGRFLNETLWDIDDDHDLSVLSKPLKSMSKPF